MRTTSAPKWAVELVANHPPFSRCQRCDVPEGDAETPVGASGLTESAETLAASGTTHNLGMRRHSDKPRGSGAPAQRQLELPT